MTLSEQIKLEAGECTCELCIRYGATTVATTTRTFEGEYVKTKYEFPVCQECADMLDLDEQHVND